ncbi:MAG TPA: hypothetical protein VKD72_20535, partial [Gemmataceae bacterium]|nr:hypothetical protein [Gemmataceae bacterium]
LCRLSGQEFNGMKVTIPQAKIPQVPFGPGDVDQWCNPLPQTGSGPVTPGVRESLRSLMQEALLLTLDSKRAQQVVAAAYEKNEAGLAKAHQADISQLGTGLLRYLQQTMDDARSGAAGAQGQGADSGAQPAASGTFSFDGAWPSPIAMNAWQKNPWLPLFLQWQVTWRPSYSETAHALDTWTLNAAGTAFEEKAGSPGDEQVYAGTTLLTPGAALHLSDRLRQYNLTHDSPPLRALQTAVGRMALLCQTFGGLTENLLMRKGCLELRPLDPGTDDRGPLPSPVFDWVQDVDWLSPLTDKAFFPVRAGHLTIGKLWVIDAFGQLLQLELEDAGKLNRPFVYERLAGSGGDISLEPRLAQPARLSIEWLPASRWKTDAPPSQDEEFDPVCGWIVPNLLDRGLMIYDAQGRALGALQAVQRKSWDQGAGAKRDEIESFHWVDIPGSKNFFFGKPPTQISDPLGAGANPHLREYVRGLLALTGGSGAAFGQLLDRMDQALSTGGSRGASRNSGLALLIGRPLALVRATIRLELDGGAALAQAWDDVQKAAKDRTGGIEALGVPVRLGDRRLWNGMWLGDDGLAGFFLKQDYSRFYPAYGLQGRDDAYSKYGWVPAVSIDEPLDLTLLMDPSQGVCATTGILPRVIFNLPYGDLTEILESKQVVFFTGPLISTAGGIRMPQPSDLYGQWSWTHHPAVEVWREEEIIDTRKEEGRFFNDTLQIAEGWLKLVTAPLAIRTFQVKGVEPARKEQKPSKPDDPPIPAQFEVPSGTKILLSWVAIGADEIELKEGNISLVKSARHPLPVQCRVQATQNTSFTLIATARSEQPVGSQEAPGNQQGQRKIEKTIEIKVGAKTP